jgi:hypothetical protein
VKLDADAPRFDRPLLVRVAHATERAGGKWLLGCTLTTRIREEDLISLLAPKELREEAGAAPMAESY